MPENQNGQASIKIKVGEVSIEYQGNQDFIESGLHDLLENIIDLAPASTKSGSATMNTIPGQTTQSNLQHMSTNTIASAMGVRAGPELIMAAVAHIQLVKGKDRAVRGEISQEMKGATTYYKSTYGSNLSSYLDSLIRNKRLNLISDNTYALSASERSNMEKLLATN